jgi:serine/threonine protein kinase
MSGASYRPAPLLVAVLRFVAEFMTPASGTRLGLYEIVSALGVGGMGEVYRAHDMRLERDVAIKILPEIFAADPERLARFEREAKVLASLNHPNIAAIHVERPREEDDGVRRGRFVGSDSRNVLT